MVLAAGWDMKAVGDQIVHGRQAGRPDVADPGDLDGCRPAGENQQPVVDRMAREVEEDIDPVSTDPRSERIVVEPCDVVPLAGRGGNAVGQRVAAFPGAVADNRERPPIEVPQRTDQQVTERVLAEVRRNEPDRSGRSASRKSTKSQGFHPAESAACRSSHSAWDRARAPRVTSLWYCSQVRRLEWAATFPGESTRAQR